MKKQTDKIDNGTKQDRFLTTLGLAKRAAKLVIGWDRISDYNESIEIIFVSSDASERTIKNAGKRAETVLIKHSMAAVGSALGIKRAAVIAVTDTGFANLLKSKLNEQ
jgi:ribosomal protein L7Ae-like RNA K-turn-binding protein